MNAIQNMIFYNTLQYKDARITEIKKQADASPDDRDECTELVEKIENEWDTVSNIISTVSNLMEMRGTIRTAILWENEVGVRGFAIEKIKYALADF